MYRRYFVIKNFGDYILKKAVVMDSTITNLVQLDVHEIEHHVKIGKVDPGFTADTMLRHLVNSGSVTNESSMKFRGETKMLLIEIIEKILKKSPSKIIFVRNLSCLNPNKMAN